MRSILFLFALGCGGGSVALDSADVDAKDTDDTDTDTDDTDTDDTDTDDTDTDTGDMDTGDTDTGDTDTGVTDTGDTDTGELEPGPYDGLYEGAISITVNRTTTGPPSSDTCTGEGQLLVAEGATPFIDGDFTCTFSGSLDSLGELELEVIGALTVAPGAVGTITEAGELFDDDWSGSFSTDRLQGWFAGTRTTGGDTWSWSGSFDAYR